MRSPAGDIRISTGVQMSHIRLHVTDVSMSGAACPSRTAGQCAAAACGGYVAPKLVCRLAPLTRWCGVRRARGAGPPLSNRWKHGIAKVRSAAEGVKNFHTRPNAIQRSRTGAASRSRPVISVARSPCRSSLERVGGNPEANHGWKLQLDAALRTRRTELRVRGAKERSDLLVRDLAKVAVESADRAEVARGSETHDLIGLALEHFQSLP